MNKNKFLVKTLTLLLLLTSGCAASSNKPITEPEPTNNTQQTTLKETEQESQQAESKIPGFKIETEPKASIIKETEYMNPSFDANNTTEPLTYISVFEFDANGNITTEKQYYKEISDENLGTTVKYTYDANGHITEKSFESEMNGKTTLKNILDESGRLVGLESETVYDDGTEVYSNEEYIYDKSGNIIRTAIAKEKENPANIITDFVYDNYGNVIKEETNNNGSKNVTTYEYDFSEPDKVIANLIIKDGNSETIHYAKYVYHFENKELVKTEYYNEVNPDNEDGRLYLMYTKEYSK